MYDEWIDDSIRVRNNYERLCIQRDEINKRIGILRSVARDLIDRGVQEFHSLNDFPKGKAHFNHFLYRLIRIAKGLRNSSRPAVRRCFN